MLIFDRLRQPQKELPPSCYQLISQARKADGSLPDDFSLPKNIKPDQLVFADGALDGILLYHTAFDEADAAPLGDILLLAVSDQADEAAKELQAFFAAKEHTTMLPYIDGLQQWIIDHRQQLPADQLYQFAAKLLQSSCHHESIKLALSILELLQTSQDDTLRQVILTLALSDEFTLFCLFNIVHWPDGNEVIFDLAPKVHGWGRIHAVEHLQPKDTMIVDWLLTQGWQNTVTSAYSALTCIEKSALLDKLQQDTISPQYYQAAGHLLQAALEGGPLPSLFTLAYGEDLIMAYLIHAAKIPLDLMTIETLLMIRQGLPETDWPDKDALHQQCAHLLATDAVQAFLQSAIQEGQGFDAAFQLGIDCSAEIFAQLRADLANQHQLSHLLLSRGLLVDELIELFSQQLPLAEMATGPADQLGLGQQWSTYHQLNSILQYLGAYPGLGEALLLCALNTPITNCRHMALNVLTQWQENGHRLSQPLKNTLQQLATQEPNADLQNRLQDMSAYWS